MSFTRFSKPILTAISFILIIWLLPGYKSRPSKTQVPAPIKEPAAMLYHNLEVSGVYNRDQTANEALAEINANIKSFLQAKDIKKNHISESFFEETFLNHNQRPEELYFYYKSRTKYAFILTGEFDVNLLTRQLSKPDTKKETILIELKNSKTSNKTFSNLVLWADSKRILLCPKVSSKAILSRLKNNHDYLDSRFTTFKKMLKGKPALAGEIDVELLKQSMASSTIRIPATLSILKYLRFIGDARLTKAQLFVPEKQQREVLYKEMEKSLDIFNNFMNEVATFSISTKGNSIFLEAEAGLEAERTLSRKVSAFILHFFEKQKENKKIILTSKIDNEKEN